MCDSFRIFPVFSCNLLIELIFWLKYYILLLLDFFHDIFERKHKLYLAHRWSQTFQILLSIFAKRVIWYYYDIVYFKANQSTFMKFEIFRFRLCFYFNILIYRDFNFWEKTTEKINSLRTGPPQRFLRL